MDDGLSDRVTQCNGVEQPEPAHLPLETQNDSEDEDLEATELRSVDGRRLSRLLSSNRPTKTWYDPIRRYWRHEIRISVPHVDCRDHLGRSKTPAFSRSAAALGSYLLSSCSERTYIPRLFEDLNRIVDDGNCDRAALSTAAYSGSDQDIWLFCLEQAIVSHLPSCRSEYSSPWWHSILATAKRYGARKSPYRRLGDLRSRHWHAVGKFMLFKYPSALLIMMEFEAVSDDVRSSGSGRCSEG